MKLIKQFLFGILTPMFFVVVAFGQTTYTWNVASGDWSTAGNWNPSRTSPAADDILIFDGSVQTTPSVTSIVKQTIGQLKVINSCAATFSSGVAVAGTGTFARAGTTVTGTGTSFTTELTVGDMFYGNTTLVAYDITAIASNTGLTTSQSGTVASQAFSIAPRLTISGGTGTDLQIDAGSSLTISTSALPTIVMFVATGATGNISGAVSFQGGAHRLMAADAGGITFTSGATATAGTGFSGNFFSVGAGTTGGVLNSVIFASGSTYIAQAGSNPFGAGAPNSVATFQSGSLLSHRQTGAPSFSGRTYANFELNFAAASLSSTGGSAFSADNFTVTAGTLNFNLTGTMNIKGSVSVASGATLTFTPATAAAVIYSGSSQQSISGTGTLTFGPNAGITVNGAGILLSRPITLSGVLTLTNGNISTTSSNLLTLSSTATVSGGSATSFLNGPMAHTVASTSSTPKTFPIGKGTAYRPLVLTVTQDAVTATSYTAEVFNAAPTSRTLPGSIDLVSVVRYWNVAKGAGAGVTASSVNLTYDADDGVTDATNLRVVKDDGAGAWVDLGGVGSAPTSGNITSTVNFTAFSDFTLGNNVGGGNPLPIQLASFTGTYTQSNNSVQLNWRTISEVNNYGFFVQRSADRVTASDVSSLIPGYGTTNVPHDYTFTDLNVPASNRYYRLKQVDLDGRVNYTEWILVVTSPTSVSEAAPKEFALKQNYPNPFNPETHIKFSVEKTGRASLRVFDIVGQEAAILFDEVAEAGKYYELTFKGTNLTSGVYFYRLESGNNIAMKKLMLLK